VSGAERRDSVAAAKPAVPIWPELGAPGARRGADRGDVVVVVDALRASVTIIAALRAGVRRVMPVLTVEEANAYLDDDGCLVAGERGGARLPQFDYGNSPTELWDARQDLAGRTLILTTSNGTRCVQAALGGGAGVLIGAAVNASAVADQAWSLACRLEAGITIVAAGLRDEPTEEDTFVQRLIAARLSRRGAVPALPIPEVREADILAVFLATGPARLLTRLGYGEDVRSCAQVDLWDTVPVYRADGFYAG
jgi:phosphosulfolactate phosphohydrolase-like enzyme